MENKANNVNNKFCAVIPARNEEKVIVRIIDSLNAQNYPKDFFDIYVIPNNCDDNTEEVAREHGAKIFKCKEEVHKKGDALKQFFDVFADSNYDAFCLFDADNLADKNYFAAMNDAYCSGIRVAQGYMSSLNPKESWISGCISIFFCNMNNLLEYCHKKGKPVSIFGTGCMISSSVIKRIGFHTTTVVEDLEFSEQCQKNNIYIDYVKKAIVYEVHPSEFRESWKQYRRWSSGFVSEQKAGKRFLKKMKKMLPLIFYVSVTALLSFLLKISFFIILSIMFIISMAVWFFIAIIFVRKNGLRMQDFNTLSFFLFFVYIMERDIIETVSCFKPVRAWKSPKRL